MEKKGLILSIGLHLTVDKLFYNINGIKWSLFIPCTAEKKIILVSSVKPDKILLWTNDYQDNMAVLKWNIDVTSPAPKA